MSPDVHPAPAAEEGPPFPHDAVEVGRILGPWGVNGGIKVKPLAADPQALFGSKRWFLGAPVVRPPSAAGALPLLLRVLRARSQGELVVATCDGLEDRDAAARLAGARVFVARSSFPTPGPEEYYWVDLIGLAVHDREGRLLGTVNGLLDTGPHCVLCVDPAAAGGDEILIPFVSAYVDQVDRERRRIEVDWQPDY